MLFQPFAAPGTYIDTREKRDLLMSTFLKQFVSFVVIDLTKIDPALTTILDTDALDVVLDGTPLQSAFMYLFRYGAESRLEEISDFPRMEVGVKSYWTDLPKGRVPDEMKQQLIAPADVLDPRISYDAHEWDVGVPRYHILPQDSWYSEFETSLPDSEAPSTLSYMEPVYSQAIWRETQSCPVPEATATEVGTPFISTKSSFDSPIMKITPVQQMLTSSDNIQNMLGDTILISFNAKLAAAMLNTERVKPYTISKSSSVFRYESAPANMHIEVPAGVTATITVIGG